MAGKRFHVIAVLMASVACGFVPQCATASDRQVYQFDLPAQDLGDALRAVAAKAGWELYASADDLNGVPAPRLHGTFTAREAVERLVRGTNLSVRFDKGAVIVRGRSEVAAGNGASGKDIVVTGSRIQGAPPAAPVAVVTSEDMRNAGQADLGEMARSLPQNFGGGQNPGLNFSGGGAAGNLNVNGASTFNLRGIGQNATLTLLNGNRYSNSGISAALDLSSIPVAAVDRVEVVADGASAIYGADAVGGVVNVILKRDYSGGYVSGRLGTSTDGGDFEQQFSGVVGRHWSSGGVLATYDLFRNTAILAGHRSYERPSNPDSTTYPDLIRQSFLLSGHQAVASFMRLSADLLFKAGEMNSANGTLVDKPIAFQGVLTKRTFETFGIAPSVDVDLPGGWSAKLTGIYSTDNTGGLSRFYSAGAFSRATPARYDNAAKSLELSAQGPLFQLPAGDVRLAVGAGIRTNSFIGVLPTLTIDRDRTNRYIYGELFAPLVEPAQNIPLIRRASISGAVRFEDYSDSIGIATPKVGLIYQPVEPLTLKASWGRSFKVPTLYQQYSGYSAVLLPASGYGSAFPTNSTLIYIVGANDRLKPERSENYTFSAELKPIKDLSIAVSYFHINYTDRVSAPLTSYVGALTNPLYAQLVTINPSLAQMNAAIAGATQVPGLQNGTASPYDPARVVAILDGRDRNISQQEFRGIDLALRYARQLGIGGTLIISAAGTWIESAQVLLPGQPSTPLAGRIFNPPHFKARGGVTFSKARFSLSAYANFTGDVLDARQTTPVDVEGMTTFDLTARLRIAPRTELSLNALNLLNAKPETIYTSSASDTPFDNTNYSAIGRFLSITVSQSW
ncbi:outer membrane receptor for ferrienterochelin and colicin [Hephaestia caeni]|uniref:Outer membrane receptor for ferrienterochelin and colicin n=1 Tax=Hephaestia caeni TaxID=645617 RepID=A0A397PB25_9SPHN|nr:TonB-dependent receptor [Hephaestia caeni]RIA46776.1 outer membrane receptor for ferrienterochelin and colicin [Hephaestia caeni]